MSLCASIADLQWKWKETFQHHSDMFIEHHGNDLQGIAHFKRTQSSSISNTTGTETEITLWRISLNTGPLQERLDVNACNIKWTLDVLILWLWCPGDAAAVLVVEQNGPMQVLDNNVLILDWCGHWCFTRPWIVSWLFQFQCTLPQVW